MSTYVLVESRDPFDSPDTSFLADTAAALKKRGNDVTVFLVQNAVLAARKHARKSDLPQLVQWGVTVMADDFSLRERGIAPDNLIGGVKAAPIDAVVERMAAGWNALWH